MRVLVEDIELVEGRGLELVADALGGVSSDLDLVGGAPHAVALGVLIHCMPIRLPFLTKKAKFNPSSV